MSRFIASDAASMPSIQCVGPCCEGLSRRGFLKSFAAAGVALAAPSISSAPAHAQGKRRVIDVHHHYYPDAYKAYAASEQRLAPFGKSWTPSVMFDEMGKNNVEQSVLSLQTMPLNIYSMKPEEARTIMRRINEQGAQLVRDNKGKLGLFAFVTGNDVEGTLKEIEYAYDILNTDGIEMMTSFGDKWPGDPAFDAVFAELNRRNAIVYFHPIAPICCGNIVPGVQESWIEYPQDSTRMVLSLLVNGTLARYRNIKWIISQSGGMLPFIANRVEWLTRTSLKNIKEVAPNAVIAEFQRLYYETANASLPPTMASLLKFAPLSQIMYGSDYPYVTSAYNLDGLRSNGLSDADLKAIEYLNAEKMFPRFKS